MKTLILIALLIIIAVVIVRFVMDATQFNTGLLIATVCLIVPVIARVQRA